MRGKNLSYEISFVLLLTFGLLFLSLFVTQEHWKGVLPPLAFLYPALFALLYQRADLARYGLNRQFPCARSWKILALTVVGFLLPYVFFYHLWKTHWHTATLQLGEFPRVSKLAIALFFQVLGVALPEEFFFRGYLQTRLQELKFFKGKSFYGPLLVSNAFFAFSHLVGTPHATRLLTFFPGLIFGWLWAKTNHLFIPIFFHALCNVLLLILLAIYAG